MAEPLDAARSRRRRARRRKLIAAGAGLVVVGAGGAVAIAASTGGSAGKRYATVGRSSVTQVVEASGTVTSSQKVTPSFPVSGTVTSVAVKVGQAVGKGTVLAHLDTTSLQDAVDSAESTLADARQQLENDQTGQASSSGNGGSSTLGANAASYTALTTSSSAPPPSGGSSGTPSLAQIRSAQRAVLSAQQAVDAAQLDVDAAQQKVDADVTQNAQLRDAQRTACTSGSDPSTGPASDACTSARADYETFADTLTADGAALAAKVGAQDSARKKLDGAIAALDELLARLSSTGSTGTGRTGGTGTTTSPTTKPTTKPTTTPSGSRSSTGSNTGSSTGQTTQTASAARLAADQAAIDAAQAQLRAAEQDLRAATLRSPISGKVAAIGLAAGQNSAGASITVIGTGIQKVSTSVPLAQIKLVKVGEPVTVAADGESGALRGKVASIGLLSSTSGSLTTFPVTVQLDAGSAKLYDGAGADVRITTGTARDVVAVPNSAIHTGLRGRSSVTVLKSGTDTAVQVTLGVAGASLTEVRSGLAVGDRVLIADYSTAVPTSTSSDRGSGRLARLLGGGGNFPVISGRGP